MKREKNGGEKRLETRLPDKLWRVVVSHPTLSGAVLFSVCSALFLFLEFSSRLAVLLFLLAASLAGVLGLHLVRLKGAALLPLLCLIVTLLLLLSEGVFFLVQKRSFSEEALAIVHAQQSADVVGVVEEIRQSETGEDQVTLSVESLSDRPLSCLLTLSLDAEAIEVGERISFRAQVRELYEISPTEDAPYRLYRNSEFFTLQNCSSPTVLARERSALEELRAHVKTLFSESKSEGILRALLLGDKSLVSRTLRADLRVTGLSHLLALSGLHLSLLVSAVYLVFRVLFFHKRLAEACAFVLALFFLLLTGAPLSLVRAFGMLALLSLAHVLRISASSVQNLAVTAAVIVFADRFALTDIGFLLSVFATLGILLLVPPFTRRMNEISLLTTEGVKGARLRFRRVLQGILLSCFAAYSAILFTLPISALYFGEINLSALFSGLLLVPLFTLLLVCALLYLFASLAGFSPLVAFLGGCVDGLFALFFRVNHSLASLARVFSVEDLRALSLALLCLTAFFLFCLLCRVRLRVCALGLPLFLAAILAFTPLFGLLDRAVPRALFVQEAQGESCLLLSSPESSVLVLGKQERECGALERALSLRSGLSFDSVVVTEAADGFVEHLWALYSERPFAVVYVRGQALTSARAALQSAFADTNVRFVAFELGDTLEFAGTLVTPFSNRDAFGAAVCFEGRELWFCCAESETALRLPSSAEGAFVAGEAHCTAGERCRFVCAESVTAPWDCRVLETGDFDAVELCGTGRPRRLSYA